MSDRALEILADSLMSLTFALALILLCIFLPMQPKNVDKCYPIVTQTAGTPIILGDFVLEIEVLDFRRIR